MRRRVPFGVWVVAILTVVLSVLLFLDASGIRPSSSTSILMRLGGQGGPVSWVIAGVAVVGVLLAIALIRLSPIGLVGTTLLAGVALLNELGSRFTDHADDLRLVILVVTVLYLNTRSVREVFDRGDGRGHTVTVRGAEGE
jgi:hypothetical protein